jgi:hypothetical protein
VRFYRPHWYCFEANQGPEESVGTSHIDFRSPGDAGCFDMLDLTPEIIAQGHSAAVTSIRRLVSDVDLVYGLDEQSGARWRRAMLDGNLYAAWDVSDRVLARRLRRGDMGQKGPRHEQAVWNGGSFEEKRVLVRCYHGLGDTLQFIRYAEPLRTLAREVIVWAQPELLALVASAPGVDRAMALHDGAPYADYDIDVEIMELPHALRITPDQLPPPYIFPLKSCPGECTDDRLRIGVVWAAGDWDASRSIPPGLIQKIARGADADIFSFQKGRDAARGPALGFIDVSADSIDEAATRLHGVDLLISVDTMPSHLAGALALPVWTLLTANCDWRWKRLGSTTPWYPSMRLFRQSCPDDWTSVACEIGRALKEIQYGDKPWRQSHTAQRNKRFRVAY